MELKLENKIIVVTGASGNIGGEICRGFLEEKAVVAAVYLNNYHRVEEIAKWMADKGIPAENLFPIRADLTDFSQSAALIEEALTRFEKIDVLVNAAGVTLENNFLLMDDFDWDKVFSINLNAVVELCRLVLRPMISARSGVIINISSVNGTRFGKGSVAYSSSKAALNRFTETLALEVGKKGIRVNAVCPGVIDSDMATKMMKAMGESLLNKTPIDRFGRPEEVAKAVLFLASEETASYITGQKLFVDGGISL